MKGVNFSCVSPASAAICTSIDRRSMVRASTGRAIDRHHAPPLRDPRRAKPTVISNTARASTDKAASRSQSRRKSVDKPNDLIASPLGSSRYLLHEEALIIDVLPALDAVPPLPPLPPLPVTKKNEPDDVITPSMPASTPQRQAVHLRVSLHCKGCEAKVRKHISRMEGVTSFNIDYETKKVTVIGEVTPLGVLNSISKVKNAQFWPSPPRFSGDCN